MVRKDPRVTEPVYQRIADALRGRITAGEFGPDDQLPTDAGLAEEQGVNRLTVRRAYDLLVNEGLVVSRGPRGRYVRVRRRDTYRPQEEFNRAASAVMDRFMARVSKEGHLPSQTIDVALVRPPAAVSERLDTGTDEVVVVRRRTRSIDGEPYNLNDSYFPRDLVEGSEIMLPVDIARGANEVLAEIGARQVRAIDEVFARMPTAEEVARLELLPATPVSELLTTGFTAQDRPVRCVVNVLPGDRYVVMFERTRPDEPT
jgi:GntR family transcriptional regulator